LPLDALQQVAEAIYPKQSSGSSKCPLGVTGRKSHMEQIWSAVPQTTDIDSSREDFSVRPIADLMWVSKAATLLSGH
jgi:hypothetical protein